MPRRIPIRTALCSAALLAAFAAPVAHAAVPTSFVEEAVSPVAPVGLAMDQPRAFTFLPDGRALIVEQRSAKVRLWRGIASEATTTIATIDDVNSSGYERGLQGIAIDPQWPARPFVYVFHNAFGNLLKLRRFTASGALTDPQSTAITLSDPLVLIGDIPDADPNHNSGCLEFGIDGKLYVSLGEDELPCLSQDSTSLRGALLRLRVDALPVQGGPQVARALLDPGDNPLSTGDANARLVYAYGFRNPWMFSIDRVTGTPYVSDVGEADEEELDEIVPGGNYGWPYREGLGTVLARGTCPEPNGAGSSANGYLAPILAYERDTQLHSIFSAGVYRAVPGGAANWAPDHRGSILWGDYFVGDLKRLVYDALGGTWVTAPVVPGQPSASNWGTGFRAAVDFEIGPDGSLYWLQQFASGSFTGVNGSLRRVRWTGPVTDVPTPAATPGLRLAASPNPARGAMRFALTVPSAGHAELAVYDLSGRRVATLLDGDERAGSRDVTWSGRDASGRELPAGVYLARLRTSTARADVRVLRLR